MSNIRPFERRVARYYQLPLSRTQRAAWRKTRDGRIRREQMRREQVRSAWHNRRAPRRLSWWKRFVNWCAETYVRFFVGGNAT